MRRALLLISSLFLYTHPHAQDLDKTFNKTGQVTTEIQQAVYGFSMAIQPADQKILVGGMTGDGTYWSFGVLRYLPNGTLDPAFGHAGTLVIPFNLQTSGVDAIAVQPKDGKILLAGIVEQVGTDDPSATIVRLLSDGTLDPGFGTGGIAHLQAPTKVTGIGLQSDGSIVISGDYGLSYCVTRLTSLGQLDTHFGSGGLVTFFSSGGVTSAGLAVTGNDQVIVSGTGGTKHAVTVCYTKNGTLDPTFGTGGVADVTVDNGKDPLTINAINYTADNFLLLAGNYLPSGATHQSFLVMRFRDNGVLDNTFAGNGKLGIAYSGADVVATCITQDNYDRAIVGGNIGTSPGKFAMCRVTPQGVHDPKFGVNGWVTTGFPGGDAYESAIAIQADSKIVAAGQVTAQLTEGGIAAARFINSIPLPTIPNPDQTSNTAITGQTSALATPGELRIFPNPATSQLNVSGLDGNGQTLLTVSDASGRIVARASSQGQDTYTLDIHRLSPGMYFLECATVTGRRSFSFIKSN